MAVICASIVAGVLAFVGVGAGSPLWRAAPPEAELSGAAPLDELLEPIRAEFGLPALAGAIVEGDGVAAIGAVGVRRRGSEARVSAGDVWHLGSCTKAMTATLCAILVERGVLSWELTMGEAFAELRPAMREEYIGVTLEQLVTNRGGVPSDLSAGGLWGRLWDHAGTPTEARRVLLEGVVRMKPPCAPGEYLYSNAGFAIAGHMAERATGKAYEELMREMIFGPLGMESAGFGPPGTKGRLDQPRGHSAGGRAVEPGPGADNPAAIAPAGLVHCTLEDWGKFISMHLRGVREGHELLSREGFEKLHRTAEGGAAGGGGAEYGCGWGGRVLTHAGSNTMWYCVVWMAPERGFAVLVATNQGGEKAARGADRAAGELIRKRGDAGTQ